MARLPIRLRLTLAFAGVMAVVLVGSALLLYVRFANGLDGAIEQGLHDRAADLVALVRNAPPDLSPRPVAQLPRRGDDVTQVLDASGRVVDAAPGLRRVALLPAAQTSTALRHDLVVDRVRIPRGDRPVRLLATPVRARGGPLVVVVGTSLDERDEALRELIAGLLVGGPIALLLAALAGYGLAASALRPVEAMRRRAAAISAGRPGQRLPVSGARDEVARLGATLNAMLARLEDALARERTFVADASHELRSPLAILKTELELALRGGRTPEELADALRSAAEETDRLAQLAEDLLVIARSDQGRLPLRPQTIDVRSLLEAVCERHRRQADERGTALVVDAPDDLVLRGDVLRLEQALGNLVDNALRHGAGPVALSARPGDGVVELHVGDHGAGFPDAFLASAFERFTRADEARGRGGTGLGLAIAETIAQAHDGVAHAANRPGGGADVWLALPAERTLRAPARAALHGEDDEHDHRGGEREPAGVGPDVARRAAAGQGAGHEHEHPGR